MKHDIESRKSKTYLVSMCSFIIIKRKSRQFSYIDRTHMKNLGHVGPLIRFSLHCTVHIGQELITRSTPFVIHFVMMPNQLSDVGLTGWSIYCKGHLHGIRLTHNNKKNPLYLVIHSAIAMANIFTQWSFKLGWSILFLFSWYFKTGYFFHDVFICFLIWWMIKWCTLCL